MIVTNLEFSRHIVTNILTHKTARKSVGL